MTDEAAAGALVGLHGFQPLTADILARAMVLHGLQVVRLSEPPFAEPAPDVVVAAVGLDTVARLDELRAALPRVALVGVTPTASRPVRQAAHRTATSALLPRASGLGPLLQAVEIAARGGSIAFDLEPDDGPLGQLTDRELEVLRLVTAGSDNAEIAGDLGISAHTVRTHVQNAMAKLGVRTRLAASAVARDAGLHPSGPG